MEQDKLMSVIHQQTIIKGEPQQTVSKHCVNGDDSRFLEARSQNIISRSTITELKDVLKLVMLKVGIRANNLPNEDEKRVLIDHILNQYGNHTPLEIRLAFDMAMTGKLDLEEKEVVCYENFSCLYFSKIMNAYREWAKQVHNQLKQPTSLLQEHKPSEEEQRDSMLAWIEEWKQKEDINFDMIPVVFYDFLDGEKLLSVTNKEKWDYTHKAINQIKGILQSQLDFNMDITSQNRFQQFSEMEKSGVFTGEFKSMVINRSKKLVIQDYLKRNP